ncbi:hypothetical protein VSH64_29255 [Amycolatopsis rhabdoformis]|uniref:LppX_LprAFG lipoprotein n=1 Tax=Amycolatopsis rhabdoformis TaxID=1448059 RepID=A0ABZ1HXT6_9PSEU|nr:hypothetical protein [Amycolatopsis rhabdoformis]WSE26952.1 hypothetical protein VSH64_29255 [Amycolatopsis rhabdoformis]
MRKTTFVVAAGAALALVLTGCGSKSESGTAAPAGDKAASGIAAPFANVLELASASKQGTTKTKSSKMSMTMSAAGKTVTAEGIASYDPADLKMSMTMTTDGQQMEMRLLDKTMYIKLPAAELAQMGTDKPWVKISPDSNDPLSKALSGSMGSAGDQSDPTKILDQISEAGRIVSSDQTTLDGQPVNHYKVEIDLAKSIDKTLASADDATRAKVKEMIKGKDIQIPAEIWVDKDQLPLQITMDESAMMQAMGAGAASSGGTGKMTIKYSDWGTAVNVTAPPADQITDMGEIAKKMGG